MIVRCGRCRAELEVAGVGEFVCPACGTRNAVRGDAGAIPPTDPYGLPDLGAPRAPAPTAPVEDEPSNLTWIRCGSCRRRFVVGDGVEQVECPACGQQIEVASAERV